MSAPFPRERMGQGRPILAVVLSQFFFFPIHSALSNYLRAWNRLANLLIKTPMDNFSALVFSDFNKTGPLTQTLTFSP